MGVGLGRLMVPGVAFALTKHNTHTERKQKVSDYGALIEDFASWSVTEEDRLPTFPSRQRQIRRWEGRAMTHVGCNREGGGSLRI